jgi:putative hydrolase of the HAD superfamily
MTIKAFVFDCGGVLLHDGDLAPYSAWEARLGLPAGELARRLWSGELWTAAACGRLTDEQFWQRACEQVGLNDPADVAALRADMWSTWVLDDKVLALIDRVRQRYRVAMLSNATDALETLLRDRYGVADRFEILGSSACLGVAKPDPAAFQAVLDRLGLEAGEVMFVDDRAENIAAAAALGLHVVWFVSARELDRQLAAPASPAVGAKDSA